MDLPPSVPQANPAEPTNDEDLRHTMAALLVASSPAPLSPETYVQSVEEKEEAMQLPSLTAVGCVFFDCAGQRWGARLKDISRIVDIGTILPVLAPNAPPWFLGVFQLDIEIASLIDLSRFFAPAFSERRQRDIAVLITRNDEDVFGLQVSRVGHALMLEEAELVPAMPGTTGISRFIRATYVPAAQPDSDAANSSGIIDLSAITRAISMTLGEGHHTNV